MTTMRVAAVVLTCTLGVTARPYLVGASVRAQAPAAQAGMRAEKTNWYFYRVKWGFQDEFVDLFTKNHYPVLREEIKAGRMTSVRTFVPTYHGDI